VAGTLVLPSFYRVCSINLVVESRTDCVLFFLQPLVRGGARVLRHFARGSQVVRQNGAAQKARLPFCGTFVLRSAHFLSLLHLLFDLGASGSGDFLGSNFSLAARFDDSVCICFSCVCVCVWQSDRRPADRRRVPRHCHEPGFHRRELHGMSVEPIR